MDWRRGPLPTAADRLRRRRGASGLSRGIEGSTATHERVRRHYAQISAPVATLEIEVPPRVLLNPDKWADEQVAAIGRQAAPSFARARTAESDRTAKKAAEATADKERRKRERAEKALVQQKATADRMRALPLPDVLTPWASSRTKRSLTAGRLTGSTSLAQGPKLGKWFDHIAQHGAAAPLTSCSTSRAPTLRAPCPGWPIGSEKAQPPPILRPVCAQKPCARSKRPRPSESPSPPSPTPEHWPRVRKYLVEDRALPAPYIDKLHQQGDCYADARRNAVFICRDAEGRAVGAELKGTIQRSDGSRFSGMTPGSAKDAGGFRIGSIAKAAVIYLVESAIDAISLAKLRATAGEKGFAIISTAGTTPNPRAWLAGIADKVKRVCAFDNDSVGDKAG